MTAKIRQIIERLEGLVTYKVDKSMSDEDFIANVDAANFLCDLHDDLILDRSEIRRNMDKLYPQYSRRVNTKKNIQLAMPLIRSLERFIYDRSPAIADLGPAYRRKAFVEMCAKVVSAYRENPLIPSTDYLYALCSVARSRDFVEQSEQDEINNILASYFEDIDEISVEEKLRRLMACKIAAGFIGPETINMGKWDEVKNSLYDLDARTLDDEAYVNWCDLTDQMPTQELKMRSSHSNLMLVEYLHALVISEFNRIFKEKARRRSKRQFEKLNDEIIGDIIQLKIDSSMSVSTLHALENIFYMRLQLAQVGWDDDGPIYQELLSNRLRQIIKVLTEKYTKALSLSEKISILNRIESISQALNISHNSFVIKKREELLALPNLTFTQKYCLENLLDFNSDNVKEDIERLLPEAKTAFDMAILFDIDSLGAASQHEAVMNKYKALFNNAIAARNTDEIANFLVIAARGNSNPHRRQEIQRLTSQLFTSNFSLIKDIPLPERRINEIAATVFAQIDKYEMC